VDLRELSDAERQVLALLLAREFPGRDALVRQAETVQTGGSSCDCGCPSFSLHPDKSLPAATEAGHAVSDAHGLDPGGSAIGVLLFVEDGYLDDVEIYGNEGSTFAGLPDADALKLSEWSEPDTTGSRYLKNP
jgi:hypothetical protein